MRRRQGEENGNANNTAQIATSIKTRHAVTREGGCPRQRNLFNASFAYTHRRQWPASGPPPPPAFHTSAVLISLQFTAARGFPSACRGGARRGVAERGAVSPSSPRFGPRGRDIHAAPAGQRGFISAPKSSDPDR